MKISIIIPIYNVASYIEDCLKSIMTQTMNQEVECILVDDCSTDDSLAIARRLVSSYKGDISFVILSNDSNKGASAARNLGLSHARGEYALFVDSDDEIFPNTLEVLYQPLKEEKYDIVMGDFMLSGLKNRASGLRIPDGTIFRNGEILKAQNDGKIYVMPFNQLIKISTIRESNISFKEGVMTEDDLWNFNLACVSKTLKIVKQVTYNYKCREGSVMTSSSLQRIVDSKNAILAEACQFILRHKLADSPEVLKWYNNTSKTYLSFCNQISHELQQKQYICVRELLPFNKKIIVKNCIRNPRRFAASLHFALPLPLAKIYLKLIGFLGKFVSKPSYVLGK